MAGVMTRGSINSALFREGLKEVFTIGTKSIDSKIGLLFNRGSSDKNYEQMISMGGIGNFQIWNEGAALAYQSISSKYSTTFTHVDYSTGIEYTKNLKRDAKYGVMEDGAFQFGVSAAGTQEILAAVPFNNAFATTYWNSTEAKYLCSATHVLQNVPLGGSSAVYSNLVSGSLNISTLQEAITKLYLTPTDEGRPMNINAKYLLVHPTYGWLAKSIVESPGEYDNANNAVNTLRNKLQIIEWPYLTTAANWFVIGDQHKFYWFDRETLKQGMEEDFDTGNTKHKAWFASSCGVADWRGIVGSVGS